MTAQYASSVSAAGDVDGDGYSDVAITSCTGGTAFGCGGGHLYIFRGGATGLTASPIDIASPSGAAGWGQTVSGAGDLDGDGFDEVVVGADIADQGPTFSVGSVIVYGGAREGPSVAWPTLYGPDRSYGYYGYAVAGLSDFDGDGRGELIVSAPDAPYDQAANLQGPGRVYVYEDPSRAVWPTAATITGTRTYGTFGTGLSR
jgi:hypothetical protein